KPPMNTRTGSAGSTSDRPNIQMKSAATDKLPATITPA
ncbi:MAG: hypothetical protein RLZZ450_5819, partial [Pseudomonadota bacterium]